jgi:hypothetical protein
MRSRLSRAEELRARADACEWRAINSRTPGAKTLFMNLANQWRELADQIERNADEMTSALKTVRMACE